MDTVYAASDVVVLTSDNEGMPVYLIEASLAGKPTVTTGVGSAPEVVLNGVTGLVTRQSVDELAQSVSRLLSDPDLRCRMANAAAIRARREFAAERLVKDIEGLYKSLTAKQAGSS